MSNYAQRTADLSMKFSTMMVGVKNATTLTENEKEYIIELLQDQLKLEYHAILFEMGEER